MCLTFRVIDTYVLFNRCDHTLKSRIIIAKLLLKSAAVKKQQNKRYVFFFVVMLQDTADQLVAGSSLWLLTTGV